MKLINWTPSLVSDTNNIDSIFDSLFDNRMYMQYNNSNWIPPVDIKESDLSYIINADIPGFNKNDIEVTIEKNQIKLSGNRNNDSVEDDGVYHYKERMNDSFERTFKLPDLINDKNISASFKNGILSVIIPKSDKIEPKSRRITIK